jgi:hypothetical protein
MELKKLVQHPLTALAAVVSAIGQLGFGWFEPVWAFLSGTAGIWFPAIAVSAGEIFPRIGLGEFAGPALLAAAILFVAVQLDRLTDSLLTRLRDS